MEAIIHGIILAFGLILPLGVQNVFVFTQGAAGVRRALPAAITAALCDTLLIILAVFGLSVIVLQFEWLRLGLMLVGILFLLYMGYALWTAETTADETDHALPVRRQILFAVSVSLLNPHAILDTVGVIGTSALKYTEQEQLYFMLACITVSWLWFLGLAVAGSMLKKLDGTGRVMYMFNKCSAVFIWGTAVYLLAGVA
ncbi:amino acid transporter [Sporosarcina sp. PTS2304]|uniref:LysE/ArgO family amino acid transporter n=1 Tax=Sporosarcina sp. PTS2304 TaxID=2283194 RepID=UPI000E0D21F8|nr:LysE/ArgO family amino acid transporter [Sporosarcina sp. PTS2304]AXH99833.1 amino acid transporter [Sporosarcina sp. PTS2304]